MLGRGVARLAAADPDAVFAGIRLQLGSADLAVANLESPLTNRPHRGEPRPERPRGAARHGADPRGGRVRRDGDREQPRRRRRARRTVPDTMRALAAAAARRDRRRAHRRRRLHAAHRPCVRGLPDRVPLVRRHRRGAARRRRRRRASPGGTPARARAAVARARAEADIVVVGLHGGSDYNPTTDPWLLHLGRLLAGWGADIVWGTGPHVVQPTELIPGRDGRDDRRRDEPRQPRLRPARSRGRGSGELLEVLAGKGGVRAFRLGATAQAAVERRRLRALAPAPR